MADAEPDLREQLMVARAGSSGRSTSCGGRSYPYADVGFVGGLMMLVGGGFGPPFRTTGVMNDNSDLIAKLTSLLHRIDDTLEELGSYD
jgi:hypothetical protein